MMSFVIPGAEYFAQRPGVDLLVGYEIRAIKELDWNALAVEQAHLFDLTARDRGAIGDAIQFQIAELLLLNRDSRSGGRHRHRHYNVVGLPSLGSDHDQVRTALERTCGHDVRLLGRIAGGAARPALRNDLSACVHR